MQLMPSDLWYEPAPFRAHVNTLIADTGMHWRLLAAHAGLAPRVVSRLLSGRTRRLHCTIGRSLAGLNVDELVGDDTRLVPAWGSRQFLLALEQLGHDIDHLPLLQPEDLAVLDGRQSCTAATRTRIRAAHDLVVEQLRPLTSLTTATHPAASPALCQPA